MRTSLSAFYSPKSGDQQNKKAYGDPPDPFSAVTIQKRKKVVNEISTDVRSNNNNYYAICSATLQ